MSNTKAQSSNFETKLKATSKNVIPAKAGIHNKMKLLDSRLRGSDRIGIIRGCLKTEAKFFLNLSLSLNLGLSEP